MTASEVLFDTWAWWEVLFGTARGRRLATRYLAAPGVRVHTSALTCGEIAAKLAGPDERPRLRDVLASIRATSTIHDVTADLAAAGGLLRADLRKHAPNASLADGIVLATARGLAAKLVSADGAFSRQKDVLKR